MSTRTTIDRWLTVDPKGLTAKNRDEWTGEVNQDGDTLWFMYRDSNGETYESQEEPCLRIDLRGASYVCIPKSKANQGLP